MSFRKSSCCNSDGQYFLSQDSVETELPWRDVALAREQLLSRC